MMKSGGRNLARHLASAALLCVALGGGATAVAQPAVSLPSLSAERMASVQQGEIDVQVSVNGSVIRSDVVAIIEAPPARVIAVLQDFALQSRWVPDLYDTRVIESFGNTLVGQGSTSLPWPLSDRHWRLRYVNSTEDVGGQQAYVSRWTMVQGFGNMNDNQGYWLVLPVAGNENRSLVRYQVIADADISAPDGIERRVTRRMLPGIIEGLRRQLR